MDYSFVNVHTKSKVVIETDRYLIHRRLKSKLSYSENYLEIKVLPETEEDIDYYLSACRNFFRDQGVNFINIVLKENTTINKKLVKYLKKIGFSEMNFNLYFVSQNKFKVKGETNFEIKKLEKLDYTKYLDFNYKIDLEFANKEWADHNRDNLYEDIRSEDIIQIIAKDGDKIVASTSIILEDDYFEVDNIYVHEKYRNKGIASNIIKYAFDNLEQENCILIADNNDTPQYMYEELGFEIVSFRTSFLKSSV